ncbi:MULTISPECIES: ABC transporter ATP-binding protein [Rahnella]|jgi:branched-chain amino acid transport system ATP-binding protein|nr:MULTISPECIES: ABC transporter ATP-binding protein [Rahnella]AFE61151.1 ABC transporter [Rahnella aquatilis HX2]AYA09625.1 ABC transporter ATP-binding protein [Rahnella aquatilis]MBU9848745.1 ABC transporter ATP-binding protein [Rahnella aceris]MBU9863375.1 ABC transporter ATP-binding protein [Rahnella aceris]MBU9865746.1 ABC transporter ATP-binding protein [Rahnella aceris]
MSRLLEVADISKSFGGNQVLTSVSFTLEKGEILGLLGPNGSGKSTLLNTISGFNRPDGGSITFDGQSITRQPSHRIIQAGIARTFQLPVMPEKMSVMEVVMTAGTRQHGLFNGLLGLASGRKAEQEDRTRASELLDTLLLTKVKDLPAAALSGGQKKLLGIACALMGKPTLLMLDEPMAGVHPKLRQELVETLVNLSRQGISLLVIEHDMHFINTLCQRCIVLDRGQIVASCRPDELAQNQQVLDAYLGQSTATLQEAV